jgi:hypothetical protein
VIALASGYSWFDWAADKWAFGTSTGLSSDVLHVHAGLLILMIAAVVWRRPPWSWRPWLTLAVIETANELYDLLQTSWPTSERSWIAGAEDWAQTMLWPTVILLVFPRLIRRYRPE